MNTTTNTITNACPATLGQFTADNHRTMSIDQWPVCVRRRATQEYGVSEVVAMVPVRTGEKKDIEAAVAEARKIARDMNRRWERQ